MKESLITKLETLCARHEEIAGLLSSIEVINDQDRFRNLSMEYAQLESLVKSFNAFQVAQQALASAREMLSEEDAEMRELAEEEIADNSEKIEALEIELQKLLLPKDPNDSANVFLEIRAGTGGDEAAIFAGDLFRMYSRYAEGLGWKLELMSSNETPGGGFKEVIAMIEGERVYSRLKYESGVHRVQRVPETETQGRVHTSAVTVAVMPEADDVEVDLDDKELRIDTFCSSGPGGQSVNTTQSAVRITHLPTNLVVQCQDEKSWHKNKARALQVLRSRLFDRMQQEQHDAIAAERKGMVGSGDRSEKIRTYNFPQSRVTDHRISLTTHNLPAVMDGDVSTILDALISHDQAERLKQEVEA